MVLTELDRNLAGQVALFLENLQTKLYNMKFSYINLQQLSNDLDKLLLCLQSGLGLVSTLISVRDTVMKLLADLTDIKVPNNLSVKSDGKYKFFTVLHQVLTILKTKLVNQAYNVDQSLLTSLSKIKEINNGLVLKSNLKTILNKLQCTVNSKSVDLSDLLMDFMFLRDRIALQKAALSRLSKDIKTLARATRIK